MLDRRLAFRRSSPNQGHMTRDHSRALEEWRTWNHPPPFRPLSCAFRGFGVRQNGARKGLGLYDAGIKVLLEVQSRWATDGSP